MPDGREPRPISSAWQRAFELARMQRNQAFARIADLEIDIALLQEQLKTLAPVMTEAEDEAV